MVGRTLIKGKTKKLLGGDPVVDLDFQYRIGVDVERLLEEEIFQEDQWLIGLVPSLLFLTG